MPQRHNTPSLYEMLTGNFSGGLDQISEENQVILSVLDNMQRILNCRAGTLALPDMTKILQEHTRTRVFDSKSQADIAEFRRWVALLLEQMKGWLAGADIHCESVSVSLTDLLVEGAFDVTGMHLRHAGRGIQFTPVFLFGQGVTGCVEASLCMDRKVIPRSRLFIRAGKTPAGAVPGSACSPGLNARSTRALSSASLKNCGLSLCSGSPG